ncbi:MAG: fibronectin type III domain-containing protein [Candidatus Nanopelagicales bacterium]|nr:fibronectin type III domain-containing protein [Candidatus Nanopelagicales bacterium]
MDSRAARVLRWIAALVAVTVVVGAAPGTATSATRPAPQPLRPAAQTFTDAPEFAWSPVRAATAYRLEVSRDPGFENLVRQVETAATRYADTTSWPSGQYWWRVKVLAPFTSGYSPVRSFSRAWLQTPGTLARPDAVRVDDFAAEAGVQVPRNALKVAWTAVREAAYYEIEFDGRPETTCRTPHTAFTPYQSGSFVGGVGEPCDPGLGLGEHTVRVRAVDVGPGREPLFSLWSDEPRSAEDQPPGVIRFTVGPSRTGSGPWQPAVLTSPRDGSVFADTPVLHWDPVAGAADYRVVMATDRGFTNLVGDFRTTGTSLIPTQSLPQTRRARSLFWLVVPCTVSGTVADQCLSLGDGAGLRKFTMQSVSPRTTGVQRRSSPWTGFTWESMHKTLGVFARRTGSPAASMVGVSWYEIQLRTRGAGWDAARIVAVDREAFVPDYLRFGTRYDWRVRVVDGSGLPGIWSRARTAMTPGAVSANPVALRAGRRGQRVVITWRQPRSRYFPVTDYTLYVSQRGVRWKPLAQVTKTKATFTLRPSQRYWFMVTANNLAGESLPTKIFVPR